MADSYTNGARKSIIENKTAILSVGLIVALSVMLALFATVSAKSNTPKNAGSLGQVSFDTDVASNVDEMYYGDGIPNGDWVVAEAQGVELGARITDRTDGTLDVSGDKGNRVGVYEAATGFDGSTDNRAEWNYEWSVDLSNAKGVAKGKTVADYSLTLEQDYTEQNLFGVLGTDPVVLPMPDVCDNSGNPRPDTLCQQSWNPVFGNDDFDVDEEATYTLRFVLAPSTFNGPSIATTVQVQVSN